jgi:dTDP-4-dehydrorhamnose reductase
LKILASGGSGLLGKTLKNLDKSIIFPSRIEMDVFNINQIKQQLKIHNPDLFLHLAAFTDNRKLEKNPTEAIKTNIIGTANVALACLEQNIRLVYISTDYVYSGRKGLYKEDDELLPINKYAWSKLGGECAVKQYDNSLIIRTSIGPSLFPYDQAFVDMWTSKDTVEVLAPMILKATKSHVIGILNLGTSRKNMFEYAKKSNSNVNEATRNEFGDSSDFDTSLDLSKYESCFDTKN